MNIVCVRLLMPTAATHSLSKGCCCQNANGELSCCHAALPSQSFGQREAVFFEGQWLELVDMAGWLAFDEEKGQSVRTMVEVAAVAAADGCWAGNLTSPLPHPYLIPTSPLPLPYLIIT